jgi:hypothetical protein
MSVIPGDELAWWRQLKKAEHIILLELSILERHLCDEVAAGATVPCEEPELSHLISDYLTKGIACCGANKTRSHL